MKENVQQSKMRQKKEILQKYHSFCVGQLFLGLLWSLVNIPSKTPLEKTNFSFADNFLVRHGTPSPLPPLVAGTPSGWICSGPVCAALVTEFICVSVLLYLKDIVFLGVIQWNPLALTSFLPLLPHIDLWAKGKGLMKTSHFDLVLQSLILHTCSIVSLCVSAHLL